MGTELETRSNTPPMDIFRTLGTILKPRKIELVQRLVAKRLDSAPVRLLAAGTPEELSGKHPIEVEGRVVWAWNGKKL
jgi:hypothetical protein